jgi:hypothetical protein
MRPVKRETCRSWHFFLSIHFCNLFIFTPHAELREIVKINLDRLYKGDKKGQASLLVVCSINHHLKVKKREKVRPEMLNVLLALKLYHLENPKDMLFAVYFRLIKDPTGNGQSSIMINWALIRPVLTGFAKFGHLMSIDYFQVIYFRIWICGKKNHFVVKKFTFCGKKLHLVVKNYILW